MAIVKKLVSFVGCLIVMVLFFFLYEFCAIDVVISILIYYYNTFNLLLHCLIK